MQELRVFMRKKRINGLFSPKEEVVMIRPDDLLDRVKYLEQILAEFEIERQQKGFISEEAEQECFYLAGILHVFSGMVKGYHR